MTALEHKRYWLRIGAILLLGALLTSFSFRVARVLEDQRISRELEIGAVDRVSAVQREIKEQLRMLDAVAAYWTVSPESDYDGFRAFVTPLFPEDSHLTAIGWAPVVPAGNRLAVEDAARRQGLTDFRMTERAADGALVPVAPRDFYVPVLFMQPLAGNESAVGFDLWSEHNRREILAATRDSGEPHTTHRLRLVQEQESRNGLLSALAVYRRGAVLDTVGDRRDALVGFASQVYLIDDVIEAGLSRLLPGGIDLYFLDPAESGDAQPIYIHASRIGPAGPPTVWSSELAENFAAYVGHLDVGGREWRVVCVATSGFIVDRRGSLPWVLLVVGLIATALSVLIFGASESRSIKLRLAHSRLQESEIRLQNVIENMPVLMSALDADGKIIAWNKECERVTGYTADGATEDPELLAHLYPEASHGEQHGGDSDLHDYVNTERTLITRNGGERTIAWSNVSSAIPIPGWASWHIGIDVTDRKRADRERQEMHEQLLQIQKLESLGLLAGGIAHDFNNLLTAILGNASLAKESLSTPDLALTAMDSVVQASQRAALLTEQLLAYTGRGTIEPQPIDLSAHVREIGNLLEAAIPKKVSIRFELAEDLPAVNADPAQLQQLIMNLVINGAEAANDRPGTVCVRTGIQDIDRDFAKSLHAGGVIEPGTYIFLEVQDDGHGMDDQILARIFDPFFSTKFTGRGLGLAAALGIVRSHGGSMRVESTQGAGSVFKIFLPASIKAAKRPTKPAENDLQGHGLILVVDDEPMIRQLTTRALTELGYDVVTACDGLDAIEIFTAQGADIHCVLLDMTMPKLGGDETCRALLALRPDAIVILTSGYDESASIQRLKDLGAAGFLKKPYTVVDLGATIKKVLEASREAPATTRSSH